MKKRTIVYSIIFMLMTSIFFTGIVISRIDLTGRHETDPYSGVEGVTGVVFTCEDSGTMDAADNGGLEFSFGNGAVGAWGPTQPCAGNVVAMSMTVDTDTATQGSGMVKIAINGVAGDAKGVGNPGSANGGNYTVFDAPCPFVAGDKLSAITTVTPVGGTATDIVIAFWVVYI